ncbi:3099_t:CDS:10 [Ambispora leptoticha]|uniref:3099_t:CDS:1 n=1 Tax=Ambispora leptoticha TaxID=144679 RepID=A0A9N9BC72_9GLOM|nr:3099_t:CDS:10 [Ambispora leptoticha]
MATYKQKPIRIQRKPASSDSEENSASEKEWFVFGNRTAKKEPRSVELSRNITTTTASEDDEWHMLSDATSLVDENSSVLEGISDVSSGGSGFNSEVEVVVDESQDNALGFSTPKPYSRLMPAHDGTGDFSNPTSSEVSISHPDSSIPINSQHDKIDSTRHESVDTDEQSRSDNKNRRSGIFKNELTALTLRVLEDPNLASNNNSSTNREISLNHSNPPQPSFFAPLFNLSVSVPSLSRRNQKRHDTRYSEQNISRLANNIINSRDALSINFLPTLNKETLDEIFANKDNNNITNDSERSNSTNNLTSSNETAQQSASRPTRNSSEVSSILSTVWMSFRRFTSNIINADVELYNDISLATAMSLESSNSNSFGGGLASIIAEMGDNNRYTYDACYLPFGNHLTFTDLPLGDRENIFSYKHQISSTASSSYNIKSESNLNKTRTSRSSLNLRGFFNRRNSSGSNTDCGLENARTEETLKKYSQDSKTTVNVTPSSHMTSESKENVKKTAKPSVEEVCERLVEVALAGNANAKKDKDNAHKKNSNSKRDGGDIIISDKPTFSANRAQTANIFHLVPPRRANIDCNNNVVNTRYGGDTTINIRSEFEHLNTPSSTITATSSNPLFGSAISYNDHLYGNQNAKVEIENYGITKSKINERQVFHDNNIATSSSIVNPYDRYFSFRSIELNQMSSNLVHSTPINPSTYHVPTQPQPIIKKSISICSLCDNGNVLLIPCGHRMCESCVHILRSNTVKSSSKTHSECPICETTITEFKRLSQNEPRTNKIDRTPSKSEELQDVYKQQQQQSNQDTSRRTIQQEEMNSSNRQEFNNNSYPTPPNSDEKNQTVLNRIDEDTTRPISWAFPGYTPPLIPRPNQTLANNRPQQIAFLELSKSATPFNWPVVKINNIPWDISLKDIKNFFSAFQLPDPSKYAQSIHIIMDRTTGKTLSEAFVEFVASADADRAVDLRNMKPMKGRLISCTRSSQEELMKAVFPKWKGSFYGCNAVVTDETREKGANKPVTTIPFVTREEMNSLLVVCRNYKLHFSRKCAERPFENIISILVKFPFHQSDLYTTLQRDLLFEMLKLAIESLKIHLNKEYHRIEETLLERMLRAGILTPVFTERQKLMIVQIPDTTFENVNTSPSTFTRSSNKGFPSSPKYKSSPREYIPKYSGVFDPFRDDHDIKTMLYKDRDAPQPSKTKPAPSFNSYLLPNPPQSLYGAFQPFYSGTDFINRSKQIWGWPKQVNVLSPSSTPERTTTSSLQQLNRDQGLYFDTGNNPFFVKDFDGYSQER